MASEKPSFSLWSFLLLVIPCTVPAAPRLVVDTAEYMAGTFDEGQATFLKHTFTLKNAGDSVLTISKIRPSCGCVSFTGDSVIPPGRSGHLVVVLDIREIIRDDFYEYLTMRTTDPLLRRIKFAVYGKMNLIVRAEPVSVVLPTPAGMDSQMVTITSRKNDLEVTGAYFTYDNPKAEWMSSFPIRFSFARSKALSPDGFCHCTVTIFHPRGVKEAQYGKFVFKTNHPHKPELRIGGVLDPL